MTYAKRSLCCVEVLISSTGAQWTITCILGEKMKVRFYKIWVVSYTLKLRIDLMAKELLFYLLKSLRKRVFKNPLDFSDLVEKDIFSHKVSRVGEWIIHILKEWFLLCRFIKKVSFWLFFVSKKNKYSVFAKLFPKT